MKPQFNVRNQSEIYIGEAGCLLPRLLPAGRVVVVTDAGVESACREVLAPYERVVIPQGEEHKSLETLERVLRRFIELGVDRKTFVLGVGGGIVTDVAGFAASTYMRGVDFGFVSTTLLGQVDASVGGKNGVNVGGFKNMAGCFSQPRFVICDPALLATLSDREFRAGLAELVKAAIIGDAELFARLERSCFRSLRADAAFLKEAVTRAIRVKAEIVERDEKEGGERRKLNLGHTIGHAIEKCTHRLNHGEAVAVGIARIADIAVDMGVLADGERDRMRGLLERMGFVLNPDLDPEQLREAVGSDKKNLEGMLNVVLPLGVGHCEVRPMPEEEFVRMI